MFHCYDLANRGDPDEISQNLHFYGWIFRHFARVYFHETLLLKNSKFKVLLFAYLNWDLQLYFLPAWTQLITEIYFGNFRWLKSNYHLMFNQDWINFVN